MKTNIARIEIIFKSFILMLLNNDPTSFYGVSESPPYQQHDGHLVIGL